MGNHQQREKASPGTSYQQDSKKEDAENRGKVIKEVIVVLDTLSNDDFKNQYAPANHAAVDLFESMPEAQPIEEDKPKTIKTSKTLS